MYTILICDDEPDNFGQDAFGRGRDGAFQRRRP